MNYNFLDFLNKHQLNENDENISNLLVSRERIGLTDLNKQISIDNKKNEFIKKIQDKINETNKKNQEMKKPALETKAEDVWTVLSQKIQNDFKPTKASVTDDKILWMYVLAQPNQNITLASNPAQQPELKPQQPTKK